MHRIYISKPNAISYLEPKAKNMLVNISNTSPIQSPQNHDKWATAHTVTLLCVIDSNPLS